MRDLFHKRLNELRDDILQMGSMVEEELDLAMDALETLDMNLVQQIFQADAAVNDRRYAIEEKCFHLIVTQQPMARDLRAIVAVMNMIVDLERMGDQTKGIAKIIPHMTPYPNRDRLPELKHMGYIGRQMLHDAMLAYATKDVKLASAVTQRDDKVDGLYAQIFTKVMEQLAATGNPDKVEATYETLRAGRELERFADLATNVAERVIYIVTGQLHELNVEPEPEIEVNGTG